MKLHKYDHPCDGSMSSHMERARHAKPGHAAPCSRWAQGVEALLRSPARGRRCFCPLHSPCLGSLLLPPACLQLCLATQCLPTGSVCKVAHQPESSPCQACHWLPAAPWQVFGPFTFYDVPGKESIPENASSYVNLVEVEMVLNVYTLLVTRCGLNCAQ